MLAAAVLITINDGVLCAQDTLNKPDPLEQKFPQWAKAAKLKGDVESGKKLFESRKIGNEFTCIACHSFNPSDTLALDGDGLKRSANTVFAAVKRTNIKNTGSRNAALGGNICVIHFMKGKEPGLGEQDLADLSVFLQSGGNLEHATARNLDYPKMTRTVPGKLTGGDPIRGLRLAQDHYCISCHTVEGKKYTHLQGGRKLNGRTIGNDKLKDLALRIRNPDFKINEEMPGHDDLRMPEKDLLDIIAWLAEKAVDGKK